MVPLVLVTTDQRQMENATVPATTKDVWSAMLIQLYVSNATLPLF